jgi:hypothetical protein
MNIQMSWGSVFQQMTHSFLELAGAPAAATAKRKFGYERSRELTTKGQQLLLHKNICPTHNINPEMLRENERKPNADP